MLKNFDNEYDCSLNIYTNDDFEFGRSLELQKGLILDFDKNNVPISIELLDMSTDL